MIFAIFWVAIMDLTTRMKGVRAASGHLLLWIVLIYVVEIVEKKYLIHDLKARPLFTVFLSAKVPRVFVIERQAWGKVAPHI